jgi:hypothetical protein
MALSASTFVEFVFADRASINSERFMVSPFLVIFGGSEACALYIKMIRPWHREVNSLATAK